MEITVNGEPRRFEGALTVADLLAQLGFAGKRIAVEVNREIVPRSLYATTALKERDRVEVVNAIGGG